MKRFTLVLSGVARLSSLLKDPQNDSDELIPYDYILKPDAIAQVPLEVRSQARLLDATGQALVDRHVFDLPSLCTQGDVVVLNDTKVFPARLALFRATGGKIDVLLVESTEDSLWIALANPSKNLKPGVVLFDEHGTSVAEIIDRFAREIDSPTRFLIKILAPKSIETLGEMPLPPYIKVPLESMERYQTVYANQGTSVAAPTAGLHFDQQVLDSLVAKGVVIAKVELSVGLDTFLPVRSKTIVEHRIHSERYSVSVDSWNSIQNASRVLAIGTTVVRTLESVALTGELNGRTSLFIHGNFDFKVVDRLMTNFHIPRSSLLLMIDAFVGPRWRNIYEYALESGYRFLSFGDAMLVDRLKSN